MRQDHVEKLGQLPLYVAVPNSLFSERYLPWERSKTEHAHRGNPRNFIPADVA